MCFFYRYVKNVAHHRPSSVLKWLSKKTFWLLTSFWLAFTVALRNSCSVLGPLPYVCWTGCVNHGVCHSSIFLLAVLIGYFDLFLQAGCQLGWKKHTSILTMPDYLVLITQWRFINIFLSNRFWLQFVIYFKRKRNNDPNLKLGIWVSFHLHIVPGKGNLTIIW